MVDLCDQFVFGVLISGDLILLLVCCCFGICFLGIVDFGRVLFDLFLIFCICGVFCCFVVLSR